MRFFVESEQEKFGDDGMNDDIFIDLRLLISHNDILGKEICLLLLSTFRVTK